MNIATGPMKTKLIFLLVVAGTAASLASTPNYSTLIAAWIAPVIWLFLARELSWKIFTPGFILIHTIIGVIGNLEVFPFPLPAMVIFYLIISVISVIPFLLDKLTFGKSAPFLQSLIFPSAMVLIQFLSAQGPSGTWGNPAYTQTSWLPFMQSVSIGGIWIIDFMVYWFAPVSLLTILKGFRTVSTGAYILSMLALLVYGFIRLNTEKPLHRSGISVAGIVANPLSIGEALLLSEYGDETTIPPDIAQSDPLIQQLNLAYINYLADHTNPRYEPVRNAIQDNINELFTRAEQFAGTDLITWSEGAFQLIKPDEDSLIHRASEWAKSNETFLFLPLAVFHTGQIEQGIPFLENKIIIISDNGEVIGSYFKNVPVEGLEPSIPGDGNIPYFIIGDQRISPAICYDADFPGLIAQTGQNSTALLILPSSDWKAIAGIHSRMAMTRAIENDITLFRPTANGHTIAVSGRGEKLFEQSSFDGFKETRLENLPAGASHTFFSTYPTLVPVISLFLLAVALVSAIPRVQQWLQAVWTKADVSSASN